ncbi:c-type cytochrome [Runella rosea]|mgnify:CR=1 FL=1|uniref:Photosynthetic reaction center cytochrome c subunit n=1 Tax=Runella rosea TaxID=2259595 RepID=A0A344TQT0_9BACT|nr:MULTISPECIES: c-type cytochrome [Runella]AXE21001.1 c-type cytochrome [Runella rosea]NBB20667.1 c-type cytochrome [Runella sp. CRIBMP]
MKKWITALFALTAIVSLVALTPSPVSTKSADPREDSLAADRAKYTKMVKEAIAGKEKLPAEQVFKNIKLFKGQPAEAILGIMENRWSKTLGVSCSHCHNVNDWASEEKHDHAIARDMVAMVGKINDDLLATIPAYATKERKPRIGCSTCHRGESHPGRPNTARAGGPGAPPRN